MTPPRPQETNMPMEPQVWKLDKHIPIAVIVAIALQGAGLVWWGAGVDNRLTQEATRNDRQDDAIAATEAALSSQEVNAATTAAELRAVRESLGEVKEALADQNGLLRQLLQNGRVNP